MFKKLKDSLFEYWLNRKNCMVQNLKKNSQYKLHGSVLLLVLLSFSNHETIDLRLYF